MYATNYLPVLMCFGRPLQLHLLIHPIVWPQCTKVTDRKTDRQDNGPIA